MYLNISKWTFSRSDRHTYSKCPWKWFSVVAGLEPVCLLATSYPNSLWLFTLMHIAMQDLLPHLKKASVYYDWHILLAIHVPTYMLFPYAPLSVIDALCIIPTAITINTNLHWISFDCIKLAFAVKTLLADEIRTHTSWLHARRTSSILPLYIH